MKRFLLTSFLAGLLLIPIGASALTSAAQRTLVVSKDTTISGMYFAAGGTLDLAAHFQNDVYLGGGTVTLSGPVDGDVLVAGGTVKISGEVKGGVRVAGGSVELSGKVGRNVLVFGGTLNTTASAEISGEVLVTGGTASISGHLSQSLDIWADSAVIDGKVDGPVKVHVAATQDSSKNGILIVGSTAVLGSDLTYYAVSDADIRSGSKIAGKVTRHDIEGATESAKSVARKVFTIVRLWNLFSLLVVAALVSLLLPKTIRKVRQEMMEHRGASIGWGTLIFFATPAAALILPLTVIGIPLMFILVGLYLIALYVSQIFLGFVIGEWVIQRLRRSPDPATAKPISAALASIVGVILVSLVFDFLLGGDVLPAGLSFLFGILRVLLVLWALGGLLRTKAGYVRQLEQ